MAQRTVWLRRDPVGSRTELPPRAEFRRHHARRGFFLGGASLVALGVLVVLEILDAGHGLWRVLLALAFFLAIGGIAASAIPLRARELRGQALAALGLSAGAAVLALIVPNLVD
jgi:hypothetical protein